MKRSSSLPNTAKINFLYQIKCFVFACLVLFTGSVSGIYDTVYSVNTNGGITFTGNTIGLNKVANQNNPGTSGSIGAFITTDLSSKVNLYPFGTTLNWSKNSSTAELDLPPGSTVLHAELVWSGSYGFDPAVTNNNNLSPIYTTNTPIYLTTPAAGPISIVPTRAKSRSQSSSTGFYVRSADVTTHVANGGSGTYIVGGVPGTAIASENNLNCCGWTLCVAYANPNMFSSNLALFVGCEASGAAPAYLSGFYAPDTGTVSARLFVSALEGDAQFTGDELLVNETTPLTSPADRISGTNNPPTNFFSSQINTLLPLTTDVLTGKLIATGSSLLDTRGSFGTQNSNAATATSISGARHGYDITSIDISNKIHNSQQQLYTQGKTTNDVYTINALGLQIQVKSPYISSIKQASSTEATVGDSIIFTITFENIGETLAQNLTFTDILPVGMTLKPGTFFVNSVAVSSPDLVSGVPLGDLAVGATTTVVFSVDVNEPQQQSYVNAAEVNYSYVTSGTNPPPSEEIISRTNEVILTGPTINPPVANDDFGTTSANTVLNGTSILENDNGVDIEVDTYDNISSQGGSVLMFPDGVYTYTPMNGFSGIDTFNYTIIDVNGQKASAKVTITVLPVAYDDDSSIPSNTLLNGSDVRLNDIGTGLIATPIVNGLSAQGGTVNMLSNGTYTYISALNFSGVDTFSYTVTDSSGQSTSAIVTITVLPSAQDDVGITVANQVLNGSTVFANDIGQGLTLTTYDNVSIQGGTVTMNMTNGTYTYMPPMNFSGIDTFTYTVKDQAGNLSVATVTITVLPLSFDDYASGHVNVPINGSSVLLNDIGTGLNVTPFTATTIEGGTVTMNSNGTYMYTPPLNFSGTDSFLYTAIDQAGSETTAEVIITILPNVVDLEDITYANTPLNGSSVLNNAQGTALTVITFQNPSSQGGNVSMAANGTFYYDPPPGFSGIDTFTFTVEDAEGNTSLGTVTITVLPIGNNDNYQTPVNTPLNGSSVLTNDVGTDLQVQTYDPVTSEGGTITMNSDGTFLYIPPLDFVGVDSFTYTAQDSLGNTFTQTVLIAVTPLLTPENFTGKIKTCKLLNKNQYTVHAVWSPSMSPSIVAYNLYLNGKIYARVPSSASLEYIICIREKVEAYTIQIAAVDAQNFESPLKTIRIIP